MTIAEKIREKLEEMQSHILFDYNNESCGIDPLSRSHFDMWYGDESYTVSSIDEVMSTPVFGGKALENIADEIDIYDW
jgi:hypothetical protein